MKLSTVFEYSVVIPSIGRESLSKCLDSVLQQTIPPCEVIVVGAGFSGELFRKFPEVIFIELEKVIPASEARQIGTLAVSSDFVAYQDDDDLWFPKKIEKQAPVIIEYGFKVIVSCQAKVLTNYGNFVWPRKSIEPGQSIRNYLFGKTYLMPGKAYFPCSGYLLSKTLALEVGWRNTPHKSHDDWDFAFRAEDLGAKFKILEEVLLEVNQTTLGASRTRHPLSSLAFFQSVRQSFSKNEARNFLAGIVLERAIRTKNYPVTRYLIVEIVKLGLFKKSTLLILFKILTSGPIKQILARISNIYGVLVKKIR